MFEETINSVDNLIETDALIEQHLHGGFGIDFSICEIEDFIKFSKEILKYGVCGFFPTLVTDSIDNLKKQIFKIKEAQKLQMTLTESSAKILGVHLEACFLNPEKKGIHNKEQFLAPTIENYSKIEDEIIKIVTLAPELDKDFLLCSYLKEKGVRVSAGHCLGNDLSAVDQVTHLYNAMGGFSHREKSTAISALASDNIYTELIADGKHVQPDVLKLTFRMKPLSRLILISDALPITHSDKESMLFCGKQVFLKNGMALDANGTIAGSTAFVSDIIKYLVQTKLLDLKTAVSMASTNINFIPKINAQIYWKNDSTISAMNLEGNIITF